MFESTHLSEVSSEMYNTRWERYSVRRPSRIICVNPALSGINVRRCEVVDISRGSAVIEVGTTIGLGIHYYLEIIGLANRIGCAEVYRNGHTLRVNFIMPLPAPVLHRIVRTDFMNGFNIEKVEKARLTRNS